MNSRKLFLFVAGCFIFIAFAVGAWFFKSYKMVPELKMQDLSLKNEQGETIQISNFKGQYVLLSYFQTWCGDCIQELQSIDALQMKIGKDKIKVILISDESWKKINRFKEKYCNTLDYYQTVKSLNSQNIRVFPTTYLLNKNGEVIMSQLKVFDWSSDAVVQLLK
jgi:peroxiredoxin